jgi:hypothetical protein
MCMKCRLGPPVFITAGAIATYHYKVSGHRSRILSLFDLPFIVLCIR